MMTRVIFSLLNASFSTLNGLVCTIVVIPRAKNIPASDTMNGWMSRYATRKPCTRPNPSPIASAIRIAVYGLPPPKSRYTAQHMLTSATTPPTEISIPPVIITRLIPHAVMINAACAFKMLKNACGFKKPEPRNNIAARYMTKKTTIVIISSRFVSDTFLNQLLFFAVVVFSDAIFMLPPLISFSC